MKTIILSLLLSISSLIAQPHIVGISPVNCEPFFGCYVYVFAQQLANKSCTIEGAVAANFQSSYVAAYYDCFHEAQTVVATFPALAGWTFFRARNDPCNMFIVGNQVISETYHIVTNPIDGLEYKLFEIIDDQPNLDGSKRYLAYPLI